MLGESQRPGALRLCGREFRGTFGQRNVGTLVQEEIGSCFSCSRGTVARGKYDDGHRSAASSLMYTHTSHVGGKCASTAWLESEEINTTFKIKE